MTGPQNPPPGLLRLEPVGRLLERVQRELSAAFDGARPIRVSRAPGRLDVMGGIADYTGSLVCEMTLDRAAAVALQQRTDRMVQVFSFNLLDEHQPFTFGMSLDDLARASAQRLHDELAEPGRRWAGYIVGCLFVLHEQGLADLKNPAAKGMNLALYSTVPLGAGVSSSAAIEVAAMMALADHFALRGEGRGLLDPMRLASLCQQVENRIVGAPCGIMDQVTSCAGSQGELLRLLCQPHELQRPLPLPPGVRCVGINSRVKHSVGGGQYGITRCAAFMGHRMIVEKMRQMGQAAGMSLQADPLNGYLANLAIDDYKQYFRQFLPESMRGSEFLSRFGGTIDTATKVEADREYHVRGATDHHVLEANRVRNFAACMEEAATAPPGTRDQGLLLDKAGHLMYASHLSYTNDARLGAEECDLLVELVRKREPAGLYGAKITGGGLGGTVAVLADATPRAEAAIEAIMDEYEKKTGHKPEAYLGSSPGAWAVGTAVTRL